MKTLTCLLLLLVLSAGCAGDSAARKTDEPPRATHTDEEGGIEGIVVDPEYRPIGGAQLQIIGIRQMVNSSGDGRFAFSGLPPQDYLLTVKAVGFFDAQQAVSVLAANVTQARIVLQPIPPPLPYADAGYTFAGVLRNAYAYRVGSQQQNFSGVAPSTFPEPVRSVHQSHIEPRADWQTILIEINWTPANAYSDQLALQIALDSRSSSGGGRSQPWVAGGDPPLRWRLDRPQFEDMRKIQPGLDFSRAPGLPIIITPAVDPASTADINVYLEQRFTVYGTIGYNAPLPADYTRLAT